MSLAISVKDFLLRPFDERKFSETIAFSALAHAVLFSASTLVAWLLPRYVEPFPSTRVEVISEAELQQRLKTYRSSAPTSRKADPQPQQQELPSEQPTEQSEPAQERVAVEATSTSPSSPSSETKEQVPPKAENLSQEKTDEKEETLDDLLVSLEEETDEKAALEESLDEALAEPEAEPSFLTSESVLTSSELAAFRRHIAPCWSPPIGAPALENLVVDLQLTLDEQAYVVDVLVMNRARMTNDPFFRSAAEAALRTLSEKACSPLKLPLEKHALWKKTILRFDPRSFFGQ